MQGGTRCSLPWSCSQEDKLLTCFSLFKNVSEEAPHPAPIEAVRWRQSRVTGVGTSLAPPGPETSHTSTHLQHC